MLDFDKEVDEMIYKANHRPEMKAVKEQAVRGKAIILFGAGVCGHIVYRFLMEEGITVEAFCDNKLASGIDNDTWIRIVGLDELAEERDKYFILITVVETWMYLEIRGQLMEAGFREEQCLFMEHYYERVPIDFLVKNRDEYRKVFNLLADELSRESYIERMKRVFLSTDISRVMQPRKEQYFDEKVKLSDQEVFVDCGAYIGDTALEFVKRTNGKYKRIYLFEAEKSMSEKIRKNLSGYTYKLYPNGVWSENTKLCFAADGSSCAKVSEEGKGIEIEAVAMDNIDFEEIPTFIKMDIEGSEKQALLGAKGIIEKYHPKLAICIYHKWEDLFELPLMMKEFYPDYRFYIRHYSNDFAETVCYAL